MANRLKVPSLQHLARMSNPDSARVTKSLLSLLDNSPTFSYEPVYSFLRDMLVLGIPYDQIIQAISDAKYLEDVKSKYLDILPLAKKFFDEYEVTFANSVAPRYYFIDKDLQVPFMPPMIFGGNGKIIFPWFIFWKENPLKNEALSLFVTLVDEILANDSDLEESEFTIVDLSYDKEAQSRTLKLLPTEQIPRLTEQRKRELLSIFAEGFRQARILASQRIKAEKPKDLQDPNQFGLL